MLLVEWWSLYGYSLLRNSFWTDLTISTASSYCYLIVWAMLRRCCVVELWTGGVCSWDPVEEGGVYEVFGVCSGREDGGLWWLPRKKGFEGSDDGSVLTAEMEWRLKGKVVLTQRRKGWEVTSCLMMVILWNALWMCRFAVEEEEEVSFCSPLRMKKRIIFIPSFLILPRKDIF